jgi:zinc resistance-associated protein
MRPLLRVSLIAFAAFGLAIPSAVAQGAGPPPPEMQRMQQWAIGHEAMLDAKLAGLKAGLKLTPDQEKLWGPFETAVRAAADMRMEHMEEMMARMHDMRAGDDMEREGGEFGQGMSPVGRLDRLASRLNEAGAALKKVADAAKPLYDSLNEEQKHVFGFLSREMMRTGRHGMAMGMGDAMGTGPGGHHRWHDQEDGEPDEEE